MHYCYHNLKNEKKKKGREEKRHSTPQLFFLLKDEGGPAGVLLTCVVAERWCEMVGSFWSLMLLQPLALSSMFLSLLYWRPVRQSRLSHTYQIQGSYFVFFMKNDPFGLEGPLVWTKTLGRDKRERK